MTFRKVTRTSQPQGPVGIDWGNPVTKGLGIAYNGADTSTYSINGGTGGTITTSKGTSALLSGVEQYALNTLPSCSTISGEMTIFSLIERTGVQTGSRQFLLGYTSMFGQFGIRSSTGTSLRYEVTDDEGLFNLTTAIAIPSGTYVNSAIVISSPLNSAQTYYQGKKLTSYTMGGFTNLNYSRFTGTIIGMSMCSGFMPLVLIWSRALSNSEVLSISNNPWQVFSPIKQPIFVEATTQVTLPKLGYASQVTQQGDWAPTTTIPNDLASIDANFVSVASSTPLELLLEETFYPGSNFQTLTYQARSSTGSTLTVVLKQGSTVIMTRNHVLSSIEQIYTDTLTAPEMAAITAGALSVTLTAF